MKKFSVALLSLLTLVVGAFAGPYDAWTKYRPVTINTQASDGGANVATAQTDFPVLVRFSNATPAAGADVLSEALSGGADVRFTSGDGETALPFEIESWSSTAAAVWVRVPTVAGNATTTIRVYWNKSGEVSASSPSGVFGSNNFLGVWHFGNTSGTTARPNAVNNGASINATPAGPSTATMTPKPGVIGFSDSLRAQGAGNNGDHFSMGSITYPNNAVTVSMWMYYPSPQVNTTWAHFFGMGNNSTSHVLWWGRVDATHNWRVRGAGGTGGTNPGVTGETDNEATTTITDALLPQDQWAQFTVTRDSTSGRRWRLYKNGAMLLDYFRGTGTTSAENRHNFGNVARSTHFIGRPVGWGDPGANIKVDETRISSIGRSPDWVKLEYETQKAAATAVTLGTPAYTTARPLAYELKNVVYAHNTAIAANSPVLGIPGLGAPLSYAIDQPLPNGLNFNTTTGVITGTPNGIAALDTFIVTATFADTVGRDTLTILVNPAAPTSLSYPATTSIYGVDVAIAANTPTVSSLVDPNQLVASFSVSPALPAGLTLNTTTGEITGTPTVASAATNYTVSATNATGSTSQVLNITVLALPSALSYAQHPVTYSAGVVSPINANKPIVTGTVQSWAISPALPAGLTFNTSTGAITGTPTAASSATDYTVTATNAAGSILDTVTITVAAAEDYSGWAATKTFTLNTTTASAGVTSAQTNFPTLVRLTSAHASIFAGSKGDGSDVRFSLPGGEQLAYEIDRWDSAGQVAEIWVLLPTVNASGTTPVRIHYGNPSASSRSDGSRVFSNNSGYVGVWHMGNPVGGNAQTGIRPNSGATGAANNATPQNFAGGWSTVNGIVGRADTVSGVGTLRAGNAAVFRIGDLPKGTFPDSNLTFSGWVSVNMTGSQYKSFLTAASDTSFTNQNCIAVGSSGTGSQRLGLQAAATGNVGWPSTANTSWTQNVWLHFSMSMRKGSGNDSMYKDGNYLAFSGSAGTEAVVPDVNRTFNYIAANFAPNDANLIGRVDEMRMSNVARDRHWTRLEYKNQKVGSVPVTDLAYSAPAYTVLEESAITPIAAPTVVGPATRYGVSPALPAGLTLNASTGEITGTAADASPMTSYTVTAYSDSSWSTSTSFNLTVTAAPPAGLDYASDTTVYQAGLAATANNPVYTGTITSWSVTPALPAGLFLNTSTGVISGDPTAASAQTAYQIVGVGPEGNDTAMVYITVLAASENFASWSNSRNIVLNTSATGANVAGTVTNFPVLVRLGQAEASIFSQALAAGADVRFAKANGVTRLPYEIVSWNSSAKSAEIWVKVDTVYGNNATQSIKMFWGNGGAADSSAPGAVFGTSNGFVSVVHLGGVDSVTARANSVTGAPGAILRNAGGQFGSIPGMIGTADRIGPTGVGTNAGTDSLGGAFLDLGRNMAFADNNYAGFSNFSSGLSWSTWVYLDAVVNFERYFFMWDGTEANRFGVIRNNNLGIGTRWGPNNATYNVNSASPVPVAGQWYHMAVSKGGTTSAVQLYLNGALVENSGSVPNITNVARNRVFIGRANDATNYLNGRIDEQRLANTARTADWVKLDYESQKTYQTLTDIGAQPPVITYAADSINATAGIAITAQTPTISGPVTAALSINPALPSGLAFNTTTGAISGTPAAMYGPVTHYVTATNNGANAIDSIVITVVNPAVPPAPVIIAPVFDATNVPVPFTVTWNKVTPPVTNYRLQGSEDSTFASTPLDTVVTDTSFAVTDAPYATRLHVRVRAANAGGNGEWSDTISFTTIVAPPAISYTPDSVVYAVGQAITAIDDSSTGGPVASYAITPDLNAATGLTFNTTTGAISGTPTLEAAAADYTIVATGTGGTDTAVVSIAVGPAIPAAPTFVFPTMNAVNVAVNHTALWNTVPGTVSSYRFQASTDSTFAMVGHDTTLTDTGFGISAAPYATRIHYRVRAANVSGNGAWTMVSFNTIAAPPAISYTPDSVVYTRSAAITPLTVSSTGGPITGYAVMPALPAGLALDTTTGTISGTPTAVSAEDDYYVVATGPGGTDTAALSIAVVPALPGAPTAVAGTSGDAQVSVAFTAPADNGGSAITSYTVTSHPGSFTASGATSPLVVTGLTNGTAYKFTVTATTAAGTGPASDTSAAVTPMTVPGAPTAVAGTSGDAQVSVAFTAPASNGGAAITGYTVTSTPGGLTGMGASSPIVVTGLTNGTAYKFTVTATNSVGTGAASDTSAAVTPFTLPGAPTAVVAQAGNMQAAVSWTAPASNGGSAITGYTVTSTPGNFTCTTALLTCTVTGLTNATSYTFTVVATNAAGNGPASDASNSVTPTPDPTAPTAPLAVMGTPGNGQASVSWTAPASDGGSAITGYTATATPGGASCNTATLTCDITGLTNGTAYTFVVTATNAVGTSIGSTPSDAVTPRTVPGAPTAVAGTAGNAQVSVAFTAPASNGGSAITGYTVTSHPGSFTASGATSPLVVTGLTNGTAYTFTVTATNVAGTGAASDTSAAVTPITVPGAPTAVAGTAGNAQVSVAFTAPADNGGSAVTGYTVTSTPGGLTGTGASSPIVVSGLTNGTAYTFVVTATNAAGTGAASSASSAVTPITVPGAPTLAQAIAGNASASVFFTAPASNGGSAITGYTVTSTPGGLTGSGSTSPISVTGLTNGTAYTFTVVATNAAGNGAASDPTGSVTPLATPAISYATSPKSFTLGVNDSMLVTSTGGAVASYSVSPALPAGLTLNTTTGRIGGTATVAVAAADYTVTATNVGGSSTATVNITVLPGLPVISYATSPKSFTLGVNDSMLVTSTGGAVASY